MGRVVWIIQVGQRELTHTHTRQREDGTGRVEDAAFEAQRDSPPATEFQKLVEAREPPGGESPHRPRDFGLMKLIWGLWPIHFCCFKMSGLWLLLKVSVGTRPRPLLQGLSAHPLPAPESPTTPRLALKRAPHHVLLSHP